MGLALQLGLTQRELELGPVAVAQEHAESGLDLDSCPMETARPQPLCVLVELLPAENRHRPVRARDAASSPRPPLTCAMTFLY